MNDDWTWNVWTGDIWHGFFQTESAAKKWAARFPDPEITQEGPRERAAKAKKEAAA